MRDKAKQYAIYAAAAILPVCAYAGLAFANTDLKNLWYIDLAKPEFMPDDLILIICWVAALVCLAVALLIAYIHGGVRGRVVYAAAMCLALMALWHYIFFGGAIVTGFYTVCLALCSAIYATVCLFRRHFAAGLLALPLVMWLGLVGAIGYVVFMMN